MQKGNVVSLEDRVPKLKQQRKKKANRRLIGLLSFFFMLIALVIYFQSPLSEIQSIRIIGNQTYSKEEIKKAGTVVEGMNVWTLDRDQVKKDLLALPEIKSVHIKWMLPNQLQINIKEYDPIAFIVKGNKLIPVLENGDILEQRSETKLTESLPLLKDFKEGQALDEMVNSLKKLPVEVTSSISEVQYTPKENDSHHISLFMNDGNEVSASLRTFTEKMAHYPSIISQLDPSTKGIIDLEVGTYFQSYQQEGVEQSEEEGEG